jgi:hypothetical protein
MNDDPLRELSDLQPHVVGLQRQLENANSQATQQVEGQDPTGAVRVVVGRDGLPVSFDVDYDWQRNLRPESLGRAVEQAAKAASDRRLIALGQVFATIDWSQPGTASAPAAPRPAPEQARAEIKRPRAVSELMRDLLDATDDVDALATAATAEGVGTAGFGRVELRLASTGMVSCTADRFWASDKSGQELSEALTNALTAAREDLARVSAASPAGRLAGMLNEVQAILRDPNA